MVISALAGSAGVGKTALAVHWVHLVRDRFGDGQLYVNLRGYADGPPVRPIEVLVRFLRALGMPNEQAPSDVDEASAAHRSLLAGRRVLVLLDNARDPEQVRPLLLGDPGCLVLVTSRDRLGGLIARDGAVLVTLGVLAEDEAYALLARLLGADRVRAEPQATAEVAAPILSRVGRPVAAVAVVVDSFRVEPVKLAPPIRLLPKASPPASTPPPAARPSAGLPRLAGADHT